MSDSNKVTEYYVEVPELHTRSSTLLYPIESKKPHPLSCQSLQEAESSRYVRIEDNSHTVRLLYPVRVVKELCDDLGECAICHGGQEVKVIYEDDESAKSESTEFEAEVVSVDGGEVHSHAQDVNLVRAVVKEITILTENVQVKSVCRFSEV